MQSHWEVQDHGAQNYAYYKHAGRPQFRLALACPPRFPAETAEDAWEFMFLRTAAEISKDARAEIQRTGYSMHKLGVTFAELAEALREV